MISFYQATDVIYGNIFFFFHNFLLVIAIVTTCKSVDMNHSV